MLLREMAITANENQKFDVCFDNEWHELTTCEILTNDDYGTQGVASWFISTSEPDTITVTCNGNFADMGFVSATQAAEMLGLSRMRVNQLINSGKLEAKKVGNVWAVDVESIERRMTANRKPFEQYELDAYLGDFADDYDVDAILDEATTIDPRTGNRYWRENIDLAEICAKHDRTAD